MTTETERGDVPTSRRAQVSETAQACGHLELRLPACRTVRQNVFVCLFVRVPDHSLGGGLQRQSHLLSERCLALG